MSSVWIRRIAALLVCCSGLVMAQSFPNKPIKVLVPFPAGGTVDFFARTLAPKLSEALGQAVLVENRPGAGGNIATEAVAKAAPDGYTLLMGSEIVAINTSLYSKLNYDPLKDLAPIVLVGTVPNILIVNPAVPVNNVKELIALGKTKSANLSYASTGQGTSTHLSTELFKNMTGMEAVHVPYKGGPPAIADLLGGQVNMMFINMPTGIAHVRSGKVKILAVSSKKRVAQLPDVPTVEEAGVKGFVTYAWSGLFAPAGTPREVVTRLNQEVVKLLKLPSIREQLAGQGAEAVGDTPEEFGHFMREEVAQWAHMVRTSGAKVD
ncbi:tripartite tricarboxylate transporter substrate binding protein [Limnohabitans sp.]|uniref:tripartite tricarboxylate transporter substrate binding protein n=1 Tax=Limnohabitans sp. TaxID=1907725 RepID=UPI0038B879F7